MSAITPRHQWTHTGDEVLIVRQCAPDGASSHGFVYPLTVGAAVAAPDWSPVAKCGGGLHGWPWGFALGDGANPEWGATWLVLGARPADVVDLGGKVKCRAAVVRHVGTWVTALAATLDGRVAYTQHAARGSASATGDYGSASATGDCSAAVVTGVAGTAQVGPHGVIALAWWNPRAKRAEMRCARVVDGRRGTLKPHTLYQLDGRGRFVEVTR